MNFIQKHLRKQHLIFLLIILVPLLFKLVWLSVAILTGGSVYFFIRKFLKKESSASRFVSFLSLLIIAILLRVFVFEIYNIPSESMENTLLAGDNILVSKLNYGPVIPRSISEIPWINLFSDLNNKASENKRKNLNYTRLSGTSELAIGDIITFYNPRQPDITLVKRCMGLPGDKFEMKDGVVLINNKKVSIRSGIKQDIVIWVNNNTGFEDEAKKLELNYYYYNGNEKCAVSSLSEFQKKSLLSTDYIDSLTFKDISRINPLSLFPNNQNIHWNINTMGPFQIPRKGMTIRLDEKNMMLYSRVIKDEKGVITTKKNSKDGSNSRFYTFKQNYCFVLGDYRNISVDSRFLGFIPEKTFRVK